MRKLRYRTHHYDDVPTVERRFAVGDLVHSTEDGSVGTVQFVRRDGWCCVQWHSGSQEWQRDKDLCGPLNLH